MNILALDLGTSSVRGLVLDQACVPQPSALARRKTVLAVGTDGSATLAAHSYFEALVECIDELSSAGHLDGVGLVVTSAQWHTIVPIDAAGESIGPIVTWLDTRAAPPADVRGPADEDGFHWRTGAWWHRLYWNVRLPWLRAESGTKPAGFVGVVEFVYRALLDEAPMSVSQASGTGMLDLGTLTWDPEACELAGVRSGELPALAPAGWSGRLRTEYGRRWPALRSARWAPATGDGAAANVGSHCSDLDRVAVTVGTSAAVRMAQPAPPGAPLPPLSARLWRYRVDHERIVTGVAYSAGGNLFDWADRELRLPKGEELEAALDLVPPGTGIRSDPRLGGDRPPGEAPSGSGRLYGLGFSTTAVQILAGLMDGLCHQVAGDLVEIESTLQKPCQVVLGGGAMAASAWWRRAFAVALAPRAVLHVPHREVGAIGAALLATGRPGQCAAFEPVAPTLENNRNEASAPD